MRGLPAALYALCSQTVTVYHQMGAGKDFACTRTVLRGFLDWKKNQTIDKTGSREVNGFLLVLPSGWQGGPVWVTPEEYTGAAGTFTLAPKDKVLLGEGPALDTREAWAALLPARASGLVVVQEVDPKYWQGEVCHVEGGGQA